MAAADRPSGPRDAPSGLRVQLAPTSVPPFAVADGQLQTSPASAGRRRALLQTGGAAATVAATYAAHKAALFDPAVKRGDVYGLSLIHI
eukprot:3306192-Pyramimonas_sp.AAC.1